MSGAANDQHPNPIDLVIASAGTGKTTRLVDEVNKAINAGAATGSILATTFTKKAAAELMERARGKLIVNGQAARAAGLLSARIGTVNATFGKILSEFALQAGRSPVVNVISEDRQQRMFTVSAEAAIARHAAEMIPIAQRFGINDWTKDVRRLADLARQNDIGGDALEDQGDWSWKGFAALLPKRSSVSGNEMNNRLHVALREALAGLATSADKTSTTATAKRQLEEAIAIFDSGRDLDWASWVRLSKLRPAVGSRDLVAPVNAIANDQAAHPDLHKDIKAYIRGVYRTASDALELYKDYKATNGLVDFIDQEQEALRLLDRPEVVEQLKETLTQAFVDEFQDTNPIQLALFLKVAQIAERSFWVGDPKQAIYGFRGTDPALIDRVATEVVAESGGNQETLATSYRARPALVKFTNLLFEPAFKALGFKAEAVRIEKWQRKDIETESKPIEIWGLAGANWKTQLAALAQRIQGLLAKPKAAFAIEDRSSGFERPIRGSDIAVLCRTNKRCKQVATALGEVGVRVSIARPGLLATPEAVLALAALRYLVDDGDSLAIAEIVHLFDDSAGQPSWFERSLADDGISALTAELPVFQALDEARSNLAELTPREALETAITAAGVLDRVYAWGNSLNRLANLDALRQAAAQYEEDAATLRSAATAAGLLSWLTQSKSPADSLPPSTDPEAVNVLNYHGAKGLEWPVVILLELHNSRQPSAFGLSVESQNELDIRKPLQGRWLRFWPWPYGKQRKIVQIDDSVQGTQEHEAAAQRQYAEALRLLYVGMTRARDHLVLAPQQTKRDLQLGWIDQMFDSTGKPVLDRSQLETSGKLMLGSESMQARFISLAADDDSLLEHNPSPPHHNPLPTYRMSAAPARPKLPTYAIAPSEADAALAPAAELLSRVRIGPRIPIPGNPDMTSLGEAVHAFLAADHPDDDAFSRRKRATETLARWGIAEFDPDNLLLMTDRLFAHLEAKFPRMSIRREVPVFAKLNGQRLSGRIDLLLTDSSKAVVIDHKSYPGAYTTSEERALRYAPQLALYATAIQEAANCSKVQTWVHMPIIGQMIQVRGEY